MVESSQDILKLCDVVRETAYAIHVYLGHGHLEKVYENALAHRLKKLGLEVQQQYPLSVYDEDGIVIGEYFACEKDDQGDRSDEVFHLGV